MIVQLKNLLARHYRTCLKYPLIILAMISLICSLALIYARDLAFDASADTLISQADPELAYFREISNRFGDSPFIVLTYTPLHRELFSREHIEQIQSLEKALLEIEGVKSVTSILDAPLLQSPPMPIAKMASGFNSLRSDSIDLRLAKKELRTSPLFKELLLSADGDTALLQIALEPDTELDSLRSIRAELMAKDHLNSEESEKLSSIHADYIELKERTKRERSLLISRVRDVRDELSEDVQIFLGGVPMVASDIISFVRDDMILFGFAVLGLMIVSLWIFFRRIQFVLIPLGTTSVTILIVVGLMGFFNQPVTAISSNFVPLLAIITISFTIHLIARYRELRKASFSDSHTDLVFETMKSKLAPCIYTALTTELAFSSLLTSDIVPVVDFGFIMCVGILVSFFVTYSFFASVLLILPKGEASVTLSSRPALTRWLGQKTKAYPNAFFSMALFFLIVGLVGISRVSLDNRFLEYFKEGTEIRDGMTFIDEKLGGTIPLDIIIKVEPFEVTDLVESDDPFAIDAFQDGLDDSFPEKYWFTPDKLLILEKFHRYLDSRPELGKSVSLSSLEQVARQFTGGEALDSLQLVAVLGSVPVSVRNALIDPYAFPESGELRISSRIHETGPVFSRGELIRDIEQFAIEELQLEPDAVHVTGMAVLFTGMLNQLFSSQASTLVFVVLATLLMFTIILRSPVLGLIGLAPNILAAVMILGFMGLAGIPLDMMTITIAAIVIGIGVDDAIHYLHRYKEERDSGSTLLEAIDISTESSGSALYFTSITVIVGFSVLSLSNFVPTVYFGMLTAMAMGLALIANLSLLPALLLKIYK